MMDLFQNEIRTIEVSRVASENRGMKNFHYHDSYEIYYLIKGARNYVIGDDYYSLSKGDMVLIKPGVMHKATGAAYERILLNVTPGYLDNFFLPEASAVLLRCFDDTFVAIPFECRTRIIQLFEKIMALAQEKKEELAFVYLAELLNDISVIKEGKSREDDIQMDDDKLISKILHYINKYYAEIENISQISDKFFITKFHLCRIFKEATNTSVIEYLNRVKIKKRAPYLKLQTRQFWKSASCAALIHRYIFVSFLKS